MTKRAYASFLVASLVKDGGKTSYKIQKSEKGKWVTIGRTKTFNAMSQKESDITAGYGLAKGTYRLVLNASKRTVKYSLVYERGYYNKKVAYKKPKQRN